MNPSCAELSLILIRTDAIILLHKFRRTVPSRIRPFCVFVHCVPAHLFRPCSTIYFGPVHGARRTVALKLVKECKYDVRLVCTLLGLPRSTLYYQGHNHADAEAFKAALEKRAGQYPTEGYGPSKGPLSASARATATHEALEEDQPRTPPAGGHVQRWMQKLKIQRKRRRKPKRKRTTNSQQSGVGGPRVTLRHVSNRPAAGPAGPCRGFASFLEGDPELKF